MQKTISYALFLFLVTGLLFTACSQEELTEPGNELKQEIQEDTAEESPSSLQESSSTLEESTSTQEESFSSPEEEIEYENGTYTETGSYTSPAGSETIGVTLSLEDDVVTNVSIRKDGVNEKTINFQTLFANGISALVVGKKLDEIGAFTSVNGSSLTPKAFAAALESIKAEAKTN